MANTTLRTSAPELSAGEIEQIDKNLALLEEFWQVPEQMMEPPRGCNLILLPDDDPEQTAANIRLGLKAIERGENVYFRHVHQKAE